MGPPFWWYLSVWPTRKLQQLTEEKDKLFSIVFHDLKSPLGSVQLYLQAIANSDIDMEDDRRIRDKLLRLTQDTSLMLERVLTWISQQLEEKPVNLQRVDVTEVVGACLRIERPFADAKGIVVHHLPASDNSVSADPIMLQLMLRVVINNAIKFSHANRHITIHAHRSAADKYLLSITDEGVGIPLDEQAKLFSIGISSSRGTHNEQGTGLGLVLAKQFAEKQGINIHFMSSPDKGATFTFIFPASIPPPDAFPRSRR